MAAYIFLIFNLAVEFNKYHIFNTTILGNVWKKQIFSGLTPKTPHVRNDFALSSRWKGYLCFVLESTLTITCNGKFQYYTWNAFLFKKISGFRLEDSYLNFIFQDDIWRNTFHTFHCAVVFYPWLAPELTTVLNQPKTVLIGFFWLGGHNQPALYFDRHSEPPLWLAIWVRI